MENRKYLDELNVAVRVVHMACSLCEKVQKQLLSATTDQVKSKDDDSLVTVADWSVQATVSWMLSESFGRQKTSIVAEEDIQTLSKPESSSLLAMVVDAVNGCLAEAPRYGLRGPEKPLCASQILDAISQCNSTGGPLGRHWILDPVDGTLGFVRGDQYAVGLAMIDEGEVVLGVLGCPNYPLKDDELNNYSQQNIVTSKISSGELGCVMYTSKGSGKAWMQPLVQVGKKLEGTNSAKLVQVSSIEDPESATFCEPVERTNSNHSFTAGVATTVGVRKKPLRVYSMVKYAAIARGDAEIYMRFARSGYKEKIWDHAAGVLIVQEAGGVVTDAGGRPLDFSRGIYLEGVDRGIIACSGIKLHGKIINAVYSSWESSNL
ncbi:PAP-specific phosphatase HAL2-like [Andrographis paniculata]|uniref:PAP-specific phosphatase HAL2-like n=1 Tax=Andrographis paniculata TaxID=175694 RepID=UPI0021E87F94|nr:PAP-specific phosphatase HAL2-like [Andrographis paniculata]XP_051125468.1 PAP-specific phosphatase HAL2-like [Andrographis paniculata]